MVLLWKGKKWEKFTHLYPKYCYHHLVSWWVFCLHGMFKIKVHTSYDHWNTDSYQVNVLTWYKISSRLTLAFGKKENSSMKSPSACLKNTYGDVYFPNLGGSNAPSNIISLKYHLLARGNWRDICFRLFKKGTLNTHWNILFNICNFYLTLYRFILTPYLTVDKSVLLSYKYILKVYVEHIIYKSHNDAKTNIRKTECIFKNMFCPHKAAWNMSTKKNFLMLVLEINSDLWNKIAWENISV